MRRPPWSVVLFALTSCAGVVDAPPAPAEEVVAQTPDPIDHGRDAARRDAAAGGARLRSHGMPSILSPTLDRETGLVWQTDGCVTSPWSNAERDAYNAEMRRAAAAGEITTHIFPDRWRSYGDVASRLDGAPAIAVGGFAEMFGGRFRVGLRPTTSRNTTGFDVLLVDAYGESRSIGWVEGPVSVAEDADGKTLLVRWARFEIRTFDASPVTLLQILWPPAPEEPVDPPPPPPQ